MSTSQSIESMTEIRNFVKKVNERTDAFEIGDSDTANVLEKEIGNIYRRLRLRGKAAQESLLSLLEDPNPNVRGAAATYVLDFEPNRALPVLEEIAAFPQGRFASIRAELTLDVWRTGDYKIA